MSKKYIPLKVIPEPSPKERTIFDYTGKGTVAIKAGKGKYNYTCGDCGAVLIEGAVEKGTITNIVIKCNRCQSYNDTKDLILPIHRAN